MARRQVHPTLRGMAVAALAAVTGAMGAAAVADPRRAIDHGDHLTAAMTGPAALGLGLSPGRVHDGAVLRDGGTYPFARRIAEAAHYDGFDVPGPHLLIEAVTLAGPLDIFTSLPVVLRGVRIATHTAAHWGVLARRGAGPLLVLWSEVGAAPDPAPDRPPTPRLGVGLHLAGDGAVVYRSRVTRASDGIQVHGRGIRILETVVDGLVHWPGDHNDGVQMVGRGGDLVVARSRIENPNPLVAALNLNGDRVRVERNHLAGGGYTLYGGRGGNGNAPGGRTREVVVIANTFGQAFFPRGGRFGPYTYWDATPGTGNDWQANRLADGTTLPAPPETQP